MISIVYLILQSNYLLFFFSSTPFRIDVAILQEPNEPQQKEFDRHNKKCEQKWPIKSSQPLDPSILWLTNRYY